MDWTKASDEQLWTILSHDWDIPKKHIKGLVTEALNRNQFDYLIKHLINKMFPRWNNERRYNFYDLYQIGYVGVTVALNNYTEGKGSFKTFAYMNIKSEFTHHLDKLFSEKRKHYETMVSLDVEKHDENEETFLDSLTDYTQDPEHAALQNIFWDEQFEKITDLEKDILTHFAEGYSMNEIARIFNYKGAAFISRVFHRSLKKINPNYEKNNIKHSGLMTVTKGA